MRISDWSSDVCSSDLFIAERLFLDDEEVANAPRQNFGEVRGGDIKYLDVNQDGEITALDKVPLGYPTVPEINYGFGLSAGYRGVDISVFFQGLARESFWIDAEAPAPFASYVYSGESFPSGTILPNISAERTVGKECVRPCRAREDPYHTK